MVKNKKSLKDYVKGKTLSGEQPNKIELAPELNIKKIEESADSTAVFTFGRFNPPTIGHEKLIHKVKSVADEHNGHAHVFASHSEGTAKDPLPKEKKVQYLNKIAPKGVHVGSSSKEEPSFLHIAKKLHQAGHKHLVMVAGSDRVDEYKKKLAQYNGTHDKALYNFKSIKVVSAGARDPDAEGVEGMSGTKMRAHARAGESRQFKSGLPKALHSHADEIAKHIRSVKEGLEQELEEAVLTLAQRRKRALNLRRREPRIQRQKMLALKRFASEKALRRRSQNLARELARARFAGKRGASYRTLSPSDKIAVDRQIQGKERLIKALAARLYQRVRKREMIRISKVRSGIKQSSRKQKTGLVASSFVPEFSQSLFESMFNKIVCEKYLIDTKQLKSLTEKSKQSSISLFNILEEFNSGRNKCSEDNKNSPDQAGFNSVNSLISNFRKQLEEDAASHLRQATLLQQKGEYAKAGMHRKIAGALARGDRTSAKGYAQQLKNIKEDLRQWFKDRWVRMDTKGNIKGDCAREPGEGKPKCLPMSKAHSMDKEDRAAAVRRKRREDPVADRQGKGGSPINVRTEELENIEEKNKPTNPQLWARAKALAKSKFDVYPSAYANGWAAKWYKSKGGGWRSISEDLSESFVIDRPTGMGVFYTAADIGIKIKPGFEHHPDVLDVLENFMDGKNPEDKGDMARHGLKGMSISQLKKIRSSETASPRKKQLAHWFINMHKGKD